MRKFLKSYTLVTTLTLCSITFTSFWTLEKDKCFEIRIEEQIQIGTNCKITTQF